MKSHLKRELLSGVASRIVCLLSVAAPLAVSLDARAEDGDNAAQVAQAAPSSEASTTKDSAGLTEIIVTARRRSEDLQKTPVAVSAFSEAQLQDFQVTSVADIGELTPSLQFRQSNYSPFGSYVGIRGQMTTDIIVTESPAIAIYVDDVYQPSSNATSTSGLGDVSQLEVLKGPQGTLYGRNTTGGAIKMDTTLPDYDGYSGSVKVGAGNLDSNMVFGQVNVPLIDDQAALRLAIGRDYSGDYGRNLTTNQGLGDKDSRLIRGTLRLDPASDLQILVRGDYSDNRSDGMVQNLGELVPPFTANGTPTFSPTLLNVGVAKGFITLPDLGALSSPSPSLAAIGRVIGGTVQAYDFLKPYMNSGYDTYLAGEVGARVRTGGGSVTVNYNINDDQSLKPITGYRYLGQWSVSDPGSMPVLTLFGVGDATDLNQLTEELQLNGKLLDGKLNYTVGYFYYNMNANDQTVDEQELPYINPDTPQFSDAHFHDESHAVYGQGTYAFTDTVHFTAGLRWTTESTDLLVHDHQGPNPFFGGTSVPCALPAPAVLPACQDDFQNSFRNLSYTAGLDWNITPNWMVYGKTSRGFKSGGTNQRGGETGGFNAFAPEVVTDYEVGTKADWFDHRLRLDLAGYHSDYNNIQRTSEEQLAGQTISIITNASSATVDGIEVELTGKPLPHLTVNFSGSYTLAQYVKYVTDGVDVSGQPFESTPKFQGDLSLSYMYPLEFGSVVAAADYAYQTKVNLDPEDGSIFTNNYTTQGGYGLLNGRVAVDFDAYNLEVGLWARNLTDQKYHVAAVDLLGTPTGAPSLGVGSIYLSQPRTFGFDATLRF